MDVQEGLSSALHRSFDLLDDDPTTTPLTDALMRRNSVHAPTTLHYSGQDLEESDRNVTHIVVDPCVLVLPDGCFARFFNAESIVLHPNLQMIGEEAFSFCRSLKCISIPSSVSRIEYQAFANSGLVTISFEQDETGQNALQVIGRQAFQNCHKLEALELPSSSLVELGSGAFKACYKLKRFGWQANGGSSCKLKEIPDYAFCMCHSLATIDNIPESVVELGDESFSNCVALTSIHLPSNLERIGDGAFLQCMALTEVKNLKNWSSVTVGNLAFEGCSHLNNAADDDQRTEQTIESS
eukprot:scaffold2134_cov93-Cylindrotheca_fusiformis.AAC.11